MDNADKEGYGQVICGNSDDVNEDEQKDKANDRSSINSYQDNAFSHTHELSYTDIITTSNTNNSVIVISSDDEDDEQGNRAYDRFAVNLYRCDAFSSTIKITEDDEKENEDNNQCELNRHYDNGLSTIMISEIDNEANDGAVEPEDVNNAMGDNENYSNLRMAELPTDNEGDATDLYHTADGSFYNDSFDRNCEGVQQGIYIIHHSQINNFVNPHFISFHTRLDA